MINDRRELKWLPIFRVDYRNADGERRAVEQGIFFLCGRVLKLCVLAQLFDLDHFHAGRFDEKPGIDSPAVVALDQIGLVFRVRLSLSLAIAVDPRGQPL